MIEMSLVSGDGETDGRAEKGMDPENGMSASTSPVSIISRIIGAAAAQSSHTKHSTRGCVECSLIRRDCGTKTTIQSFDAMAIRLE